MMLAHYHGQIWNGAELASAMGVSDHTVRSYLDLLTGTFLIRQIQPWFENISKRQVKSPRIYIRDSGLLHALLSLVHESDLEGHPKYGASWEGFALEQVLSLTSSAQAFFWSTYSGSELDLLILKQGRRFGFEFKASDAPDMTKSLNVALEDLHLKKAFIVYPGTQSYRVHEKVEVVPLTLMSGRIKKLI